MTAARQAPGTPPGGGVAGTLLADRYRLLERIAVGGTGEVWRAEDLLLWRTVAVKTLRVGRSCDEERERFRAEARHAGHLTHPGIVSVHDFGEADDLAWLVMELVEGEPLSALLQRERSLSVDRTLDVVAQTAAALHAAHVGGVVHRDVKPGNLVVRPDGVVTLTDFGIASAVDAAPLPQTGLVVGTAYYLSPEQAAGRSGSPASDVYSLGVVAYECLTGTRPFPGDDPVAVALAHRREAPPELPAQLPAPVRALVLRALAKDPGDRFADAAQLAALATALRSSAPVVEVPAPVASHRLPRPARRPPGARARSSRSAVRTALALLAVLVTGVALRTALAPFAGPASTVVPGVTAGMTETRARDLLDAAGLAVDRRTRVSSDVPAGRLLSVAPAAGSPVDVGSTVLLLVSRGPLTVPVDAGAHLGRPAPQVRAELAAQGLVPRLAYDGVGTPVGTVSAVEPSGEVTTGSVVRVHVVPEPPR